MSQRKGMTHQPAADIASHTTGVFADISELDAREMLVTHAQ